jgi:group II intron reverse transcriptase/maturase
VESGFKTKRNSAGAGQEKLAQHRNLFLNYFHSLLIYLKINCLNEVLQHNFIVKGDVFRMERNGKLPFTKTLLRLEQIEKKNKENENWINEDLYRLLYKEDMYLSAYEKMKSNKGARTKGTTSETLDGFSLNIIQAVIEKMRNNTFDFHPARRILIPKLRKNTFRPLGIPNATDKVVQEALRTILEAIYESSFSENSHGFRPNKSCHSALRQVEQTFHGIKWLIEGHIKAAYDTVDHKVLLKLLRLRVKDERFIQLIHKALKAGYGYLEKAETPIPSIIGTPQGSIISPILFHIFRSHLDFGIKRILEKYMLKNREKKRKTTTSYNENSTNMSKVKEEISTCVDPLNRKLLTSHLRRLKRQRVKIQAYQTDSLPISIRYVRYTDDWIVGINGPRKLAETVKSEIAEFLKQELHLDLSAEKTKITYLKKDIGLFLGYQLRVDESKKITTLKNKAGMYYTKRTTRHFMKLDAPIQRIISRLCLKGFCDDEGKPLSKRAWTTLEDHLIIRRYNEMLNGLFQYYSGADNQRKLIRIQFILQHSCACTLGQRHRSTVPKIYAKHGKDIQVMYNVVTKKGPQERKVSLNLRKFHKSQKKWSVKQMFYDLFQTYA